MSTKGETNMTEIMKDLDQVFNIISSIPVSGNAVDAMAVARNKLRHVYAEIEKMETENTEDPLQNGTT